MPQISVGDPAKLVVNEGNQPVESAFVAPGEVLEKNGDSPDPGTSVCSILSAESAGLVSALARTLEQLPGSFLYLH